jgi:hypothetical protein
VTHANCSLQLHPSIIHQQISTYHVLHSPLSRKLRIDFLTFSPSTFFFGFPLASHDD